MGEAEPRMRTRRQLKPGQENNFAFQTAEGALEGWNKISADPIPALPGAGRRSRWWWAAS